MVQLSENSGTDTVREVIYYTPGTLDDPYPYKIVAAGHNRVGPMQPAHTAIYRQHTFIYTISGRGKVKIAGKSLDACAGTVTWLDTSRNYAHSCHPDHDHWQHIWFGMSGYRLDKLFDHIVGVRSPVHAANPDFRAIFEEVFNHLKKPDHVKAPMSAVLAARLINALSLTETRTTKPASSAFDAVIRSVRATIDQRWSVEKMAAISAYSVSHFHRDFRKAHGVSPMEWVRLERINAAKYLLSSTDMSIFEIGQKCGYPDPYHFSRVFSRTAGLPPTGFRKLSGL